MLSHYIIRYLFFIFVILSGACTKDTVRSKSPKDPVSGQGASNDLPPKLDNPSTTILGPESCYVSSEFKNPPPFFIKQGGQGLFVTRLLNPCMTREGQWGYSRASSWMAMGVPCSGGKGKIVLKRPFYAPKMVTLHVSTDCPMNPASHDAATVFGRGQMALSDESSLMAYNPFSIQYWEIVGYPDADTGDSIHLRSVDSLQIGWRNFLIGQPIRVYFYGRENAWVQGNFVYFIEANIRKETEHSFRLEVVRARTLNQLEVNLVKSRCESLRPRRDCDSVFK